MRCAAAFHSTTRRCSSIESTASGMLAIIVSSLSFSPRRRARRARRSRCVARRWRVAASSKGFSMKSIAPSLKARSRRARSL